MKLKEFWYYKKSNVETGLIKYIFWLLSMYDNTGGVSQRKESGIYTRAHAAFTADERDGEESRRGRI